MPTPKSLNAKQQLLVQQYLANPDQPEGGMTVWQVIERKSECCQEIAEHLRRDSRFAALPADQLRIIALIGETSGDGIYPPGCLPAGVCRRFSMDSPVELALRLSLAARYQFVAAQFSENSPFDELWRPALLAVASHDFAAADRILHLCSPVIEKPNNRAYAAIFTALCAIMAKDATMLESAIAEAQKRKSPAYVSSINLVLAAVAAGSASQFAHGVAKMLRNFKTYMYRDDLYGLLDPFAIGLYEACRLYSPDIVTEFNVSSDLPWDGGYVAWLQTCDDITAHFNRAAVPAELRPLIVDLQVLEWGRQVRENW